MPLSSYRASRLAMFAVAGAALAATGSIALAATSAASAIATRQANYEAMGDAMKVLRDQLRGGSPQKSPVVAAAKVIAAKSRPQASLFPAGSGPGAGVKTDALPAIWANKADFDARMKKIVAEADKLVAAAESGSISATQEQYRVVGLTCKGCHDNYRAD